MKNKKIIAGILVWLVCVLTACGDGAIEWDSLGLNELSWENFVETPPEAVKVTAEIAEEKEPDRFSVLMGKYGTSACSNEDYVELAQIYIERFQNKNARDVLELSCRLAENPAGYELLQQIAVNIAEENETIQKMAENLIWNLETEDSYGEAAAMLYYNSWSQMMMPKMGTGVRNYYLETEGQRIYIQTGFDACGGRKNTIWKVEDSEVVVIVQTEGSFQVMKTGLKDGMYDGPFESWRFSLADSDVWNESGTFAAGQCQGEYTARVKFGKMEGDVLSLWNNRKIFDYTVYQGAFDENGASLVKQPEEFGDHEGSTVLVYAYAEDKKSYLSVDSAKTGSGFGAELLGCPRYPAYVPYAVENTVSGSLTTESSISVRVLDGHLLVFDGTMWRDFGDVETYITADPLYKVSKNEGNTSSAEGREWEDIYVHFNSGKLKKAMTDIWAEEAAPAPVPTATPTAAPTAVPTATPTAKPTATPTAKPTATPTAKPTATPTAKPTATPTAKPTATPTAKPTATPTAKPTATPTPTPTPVPTPTPTPVPTPTPTPVPTPTPTPVPTPTPTPTPTPVPTPTPTPVPTSEPTPVPTPTPDDNETDVEWTPDLM